MVPVLRTAGTRAESLVSDRPVFPPLLHLPPRRQVCCSPTSPGMLVRLPGPVYPPQRPKALVSAAPYSANRPQGKHMADEIDRIIATINHQKGELMGLNALLAAFARTLPPEQLAALLSEYDTEIAHARSTLAYSTVPEEVISGFEQSVQTWNAIRVEPNQS